MQGIIFTREPYASDKYGMRVKPYSENIGTRKRLETSSQNIDASKYV
jgi:hypothetical protein